MKQYIFFAILIFYSFVGVSQTSERIYLHTDKQAYLAGEVIWFKAYLLLQFSPDDEVSNFYIDLLDVKGNILQKKKMPLFLGTTVGNIDIDLSLAQGIYFLKSYTKSGSIEKNISLKTIYLFNPSFQQPIINSSQSFYDCQFFSQADHLIAGLKNTIYFRATGIYNTPIDISGSMLDEDNQSVFEFKNEDIGIGKLQWTPIIGKTYSAKINFPNNVTKTYPLPSVSSRGLIISAINFEKYISLHLLQQGTIYENQKLTLMGVMGDKLAFKHEFAFTSHEYDGKISIVDLPEGILHIMVLYGDSVVAESKTFIQRLNNSGLRLTSDFNKEGDINFSLLFPDSISGTFSISVTDYDKEIVPAHNNIFTELLINQEDLNKTTVLPAKYIYEKSIIESVVNTTSSKKKQLELIEENVLVPADSNYLILKGKVVDAKTKKPASKGELIIFFNGKDSSSAIFTPTISSEGNFSIKNLIFFDTATFHYEWKGKHLIEVIPGFEDQPGSITSFMPPFFADVSIFSSENLKKSQNLYKQLTDSFGNKTLPLVTVRAKSSSTLKEQVNNKYATGLFSSSGMARILDLIHEPPQNNGINIFDYLQGKISDLIIQRISAGQYSLTSARTISISGPSTVKLFLNQSEVSPGAILGILLSEVAMIKYYPPGYARLPGIGSAGVLAIYTKKNEDIQTPLINLFSNSFKMPGYSPVKDFTDQIQINKKINLTTLYWNPQVLIDRSVTNYSFKIERANSTKRFHVVVEGFAFNGDILFLDTIIERN